MFSFVVLVATLASGQCPSCGPAGAGGGGQGVIFVKPAPSHTTCCPIGCNGQNCYSCTRPLAPGAIPYNYRTDFNYPWSQMPLSVVPPGWHPPAIGYPDYPEYPAMPEEVPAIEARHKIHTIVPRTASAPKRPDQAGSKKAVARKDISSNRSETALRPAPRPLMTW